MQSEGFAEFFDANAKIFEMKINDSSPEAVEVFLRFLYTGKLENFAEKPIEIFSLAAKFKVPSLRDVMQKIIVAQLDGSTAFKAFSLAHSTGSDDLKLAAFTVIRKMFPDRKLPECLMEDLKKVEAIVTAKEKLDAMMNHLESLGV